MINSAQDNTTHWPCDLPRCRKHNSSRLARCQAIDHRARKTRSSPTPAPLPHSREGLRRSNRPPSIRRSLRSPHLRTGGPASFEHLVRSSTIGILRRKPALVSRCLGVQSALQDLARLLDQPRLADLRGLADRPRHTPEQREATRIPKNASARPWPAPQSPSGRSQQRIETWWFPGSSNLQNHPVATVPAAP